MYVCRPEEHIDFNAPPTTMPEAPDCTQVINLDFSIHAFEHLEVFIFILYSSNVPILNAFFIANNKEDLLAASFLLNSDKNFYLF